MKKGRGNLYVLPFSSPDENMANGRRSKPIPGAALHTSGDSKTVDSYLPQRFTFFDVERKVFGVGESRIASKMNRKLPAA